MVSCDLEIQTCPGFLTSSCTTVAKNRLAYIIRGYIQNSFYKNIQMILFKAPLFALECKLAQQPAQRFESSLILIVIYIIIITLTVIYRDYSDSPQTDQSCQWLPLSLLPICLSKQSCHGHGLSRARRCSQCFSLIPNNTNPKESLSKGLQRIEIKPPSGI